MIQTLCRQAIFLLLGLGALPAADISGLWMGQLPGRFGKTEDISFQFKMTGTVLAGKLFGEEFDLPIEAGSVQAEKITFIITSTNYYNRDKVQFRYSGVVIGDEIELTRERLMSDTEKTARAARPDAKTEAAAKPFRIKRLTGPATSQSR